MKKVILALAVVLVSGNVNVFAQKANVNKAKNKALAVENPDFTGAREAIKLALEDESTKNDANTWYVAGLIGYKENEKLIMDASMGMPIDDNQRGTAIVESYDYFVKADALGQIPNEKGKVNQKIRREVKPKMMEYFTNQINLVSYGAQLYESQQYAEAYNVFMRYINLPSLPMFADPKDQSRLSQDSTYQMVKYYAAVCASSAKMPTEAIALFRDLTDDNFETLLVYQLLYQEYQLQQDTVNYVATLKEAHQKFPKEPWFLQNLINHFIFTDQKEEAIVYLNAAIEAEPNVAQYYNVKGNLEESFGNHEVAIEAFQKSIEIDPNMADAYVGLGIVYSNQADKILEKAMNITDNVAYKVEQDKAAAIYKESVPYFEKAVKVNPEDRNVMLVLRGLYYRLDMQKEYDEISKQLGM